MISNVDLIEENSKKDEPSAKAYKITLMKLPNKCKQFFENEVKLLIKKKNTITIGEFVHHINNDKVNYDIIKGVFSDYIINHCINIYVVFEIEYDNFNLIEKYNYQRKTISYLDIMNDSISEFSRTFAILDITKIEFIPYNYDIMIQLPFKLYKTINIEKNINLKYLKEPYKQIKEELQNIIKNIKKYNNVINIVGKNRNGINYIIRTIADKYGYYFFKKNVIKFSSYNNLSDYIKKREYSFPCIIIFKKCDKNNVEKLLTKENMMMMKLNRGKGKDN